MKTGIVCANGIGDAIILSLLAYPASSSSTVTLFHPKASQLQPLFPDLKFLHDFNLDELKSFDTLILQNDHSKKAWDLFFEREKGNLSHLKILFPTQTKMKIYPQDYLCDPRVSFTDSVKKASRFFFENKTQPLQKRALQFDPKDYRKFPKQVILHPTSAEKRRNWPEKKFLLLSNKLKELGYEPILVMTEEEKKTFPAHSFRTFISQSLVCLAKQLYESGFFIGNDSGIGHLASFYKIPTLTISGNKKRVLRWRPDFFIGEVIYPRVPLPNFKGIVSPFFDGRIRDNYWQYFLTVSKVVKRFDSLVEKFQNTRRAHDS